METLETHIKTFLSTTSVFVDGNGYGGGGGSGGGCSYGDGSGAGFGSGGGDGYSNGYGNGYGNCFGDGYGSGAGDGFGFGIGDGGIKELNGDNVHLVDGLQTIIKSVHGNIAQGFILKSDLTLQPCYIVKEQNYFAHSDTLHDAFTSLQEKLERIYDESTEEERIEAFVKKFPDYDTPYSNRDLFDYHHVLTGSCRMGRESFCKDKGINIDGSTTVREFVSLTKDSYGSETIRMLPQAYGVNEQNE